MGCCIGSSQVSSNASIHALHVRGRSANFQHRHCIRVAAFTIQEFGRNQWRYHLAYLPTLLKCLHFIQAFAQYAPSGSDPKSLTSLPLHKLVYILCNLLTLGVGLWKCRSMGLLPTGTGDWLAFETRNLVRCLLISLVSILNVSSLQNYHCLENVHLALKFRPSGRPERISERTLKRLYHHYAWYNINVRMKCRPAIISTWMIHRDLRLETVEIETKSFPRVDGQICRFNLVLTSGASRLPGWACEPQKLPFGGLGKFTLYSCQWARPPHLYFTDICQLMQSLGDMSLPTRSARRAFPHLGVIALASDLLLTDWQSVSGHFLFPYNSSTN